MGKWVHRLTEVDKEAKRALCANCGFVRIRVKGDGKVRCLEAHRALLGKPKAEWLDWLSDHCEICGRTDRLIPDHNHATNTFRGTLCSSCNSAIGLLGDSIDNLKKAQSYLEAHGSYA